MYNLTDYNQSSLRIIANALDAAIKDKQRFIEGAEKFIPEPMLSDVTRRDRREVSVLREHNVHVLTALQIVRDREAVSSN